MQGRILSFAAAVAASVMTVQAHHSIAGAYDTNRQVKLEGTVAEFHFVNPHPYVTMQVTNNDGNAQSWRLEMDNRSELADIGIDAATFKPGDRVVASGSAARAKTRGLYLLRLDRPADGLRYEQIGYSPSINLRLEP